VGGSRDLLALAKEKGGGTTFVQLTTPVGQQITKGNSQKDQQHVLSETEGWSAHIKKAGRIESLLGPA